MKTTAAVAWGAGQPLEIETIDLAKPKAGYDHSYFFISTFIDDHLVS